SSRSTWSVNASHSPCGWTTRSAPGEPVAALPGARAVPATAGATARTANRLALVSGRGAVAVRVAVRLAARVDRRPAAPSPTGFAGPPTRRRAAARGRRAVRTGWPRSGAGADGGLGGLPREAVVAGLVFPDQRGASGAEVVPAGLTDL